VTSDIRTHSLTGIVRNQGLSVANVSVALYELYDRGLDPTPDSGDAIQRAKTSAKGEFKFSLVPGRYRLEFEPDGFSRYLKHSEIVEVQEELTLCNVSISTGLIVSGFLRTEDGATLPDCQLVMIGIEPTSYRAVADIARDGSFQVTVPRGRYHIGARSAAHRGTDAGSAPAMSFVSQQTAVLEIQNDETFDLALPELVKLAGEVTDPNGKPASGARIEVTPSMPKDCVLAAELELVGSCVSDANGRFAVMVEPGNHDLRIEAPNGVTWFGMRELSLDIKHDTIRKFQLAESFKLRGQVQYEGEPLSNCLVRARGLERDVEVIARTDEKGNFSINVPSGNYKLVVTAHPKDAPTVTIDGEKFSGLAAWTRMVVVGRETRVAVKLQQGTAVHGRILDENGQPRAGVRVSMFVDSGQVINNEKLEHALAGGVTDADGHYCLFVSPGSYWMAVDIDLYNSTKVEVGSKPTKMDITWRGWSHAKLEILDEAGLKLTRCRVTYAPYGTKEFVLDELNEQAPPGCSRGCALTDERGICELTLPPNVYTFRIVPPPDSSYAPNLIKQVSIMADWSRTIRLSHKSEPPAT